MDDSLEAFQLPQLKKRAPKRPESRNCSSQPVLSSEQNARQPYNRLKLEIKKINTKNENLLNKISNDTLDEVDEIENFVENENFSSGIEHEKQNVKINVPVQPYEDVVNNQCVDIEDEKKKSKVESSPKNCNSGTVQDHPDPQSLDAVCFSPGGLCTICGKKIEKRNCQDHFKTCFRNRFASASDRNCPTCGKTFISKAEFKTHTKECEKENVEVAKAIMKEKVTSSYFKSEQGTSGSNNASTQRSYCPTCSIDITHFNASTRQHHVNRCLDSQSCDRVTRKSPIKLKVAQERKYSADDQPSCLKCGKNFKSQRGLKVHMKSCPNKDGTLTLNEFLATATKPKRRRKLNNPKSEDEELIQVAKALSKSEIEVEKAKKKMARAKKKEIPIPAMLEMSMQSRKAALDARAAQLVMTVGSETGNKSEEDTEVSSTPVLPTPKWKSVKTAGNTEVSANLDPFQMNDIPDAKLQVSSDTEDCDIDSKAEDGNDQAFKVPKTLTSPQAGKTSKFSRPSSSKWGLTGGNSLTRDNYKVSGLLSQFDTSDVLVDADIIETVISPSIEAPVVMDIKTCENVNESETIETVEDHLTETNFEDDGKRSESEGIMSSPPHTDVVNEVFVSPYAEIMEPREDSADPDKENIPIDLVFEHLPSHSAQDDDKTCKNTSYDQLMGLSNAMGGLLNNVKYSDMTVVLPKGSEHVNVYIHRCVLFCRAPGLLKILEDCCNSEDICHLSHCNSDDFMELLQFIYTGLSDLPDPSKLLEKVEMQLKEDCKTVENKTVILSPDDNETEVHSIEKLFDASEYEVIQGGFENTLDMENGDLETRSQSSPVAKFVQNDGGQDRAHGERSQSLDMFSEDDLFENVTPKLSRKSLNLYSPHCPIPCDDLKTSGTEIENKSVIITDESLEKQKTNSVDDHENEHDSSSGPFFVKRVNRLKRKSIQLTPIAGNRSKSLRLTGSTPKLDSTLNPIILLCPLDEKDISVISPLSSHVGNNTSSVCLASDHTFAFDSLIIGAIDETNKSAEEIVKTPNKPDKSEHSPLVPDVFYGESPSAVPFQTPGTETNSPPVFNDTFEFDSAVFAAFEDTGNVETEQNEKFVTPKPRRRKEKSKPVVPITPMANFSDMDTPDIIRKGRAYGLKPSLGKKKLKIKLKEAFRFHRQVESSSSEDEQPPEIPDEGSNPKMTKPFQECSTQNKPTSSEFNFETDSESDDATNKNNDSYRVEMRKVLEARTMLEKLSNKGFRQKLTTALNSSLKMGHMAKSLRSVATSSVGIPRGSRQDMQRWSNRLSPGTSTYSRELNILLGLSENKKEALVSALTTFSIEQANILGDDQQYLFDALPHIYRVMLKLNKDLQPD